MEMPQEAGKTALAVGQPGELRRTLHSMLRRFTSRRPAGRVQAEVRMAAAAAQAAADQAEVEEIVDGVLASVPELLRSVCDRDGI
eukprot:3097303-Prymnesium_polylepis.1